MVFSKKDLETEDMAKYPLVREKAISNSEGWSRGREIGLTAYTSMCFKGVVVVSLMVCGCISLSVNVSWTWVIVQGDFTSDQYIRHILELVVAYFNSHLPQHQWQ